jgi:predicted nuclease of predicted toxin-antitoxin system
MRVKLDENLPAALADALRQLGHDVDTIDDEKLSGQPDEVVLGHARRADRVLFTLDKGVGDARRAPTSRRGGVVVLRLRGRGANAVTSALLAAIPRLRGKHLRGRITIVTEATIRSRR